MDKKQSKIIELLISTKVCVVLSLFMCISVIFIYFFSKQARFDLMIARTVMVLVILCIASLTFSNRKQPLFIQCIFGGVLCLFLYQIWMLCNYIWISAEDQSYAIEILSTVGFYLFLFTSSYGALDSLADDGSKTYRKYRLGGLLAAGSVTAVWLIRFVVQRNIAILVIGCSITLLTYIACKQLIIPDIEDGFIRTLRPYNFLVLMLVLSKLVELSFYGVSSMGYMLVISRVLNIILAIWLFPLACKGVQKWNLV